MNYTAILKRAWHITWRHRALWLFGILLALFSGGGSGGGGSNVGQGLQYRLNDTDLSRLHFGPPNWAVVLAIVGIALLVLLVLIVLSVIVNYLSRAALIGMVDEIERTEHTTIASGFRTGWERFLRLFAIALVIDLPAAIVILLSLGIVALPLILLAPAIAMESAALGVIGVVLAIGLFLIWLLAVIVLAAALSLLKEFMYRKSVLERQGVFQSIGEGYRMVRRNLRDAGLTWLILFGLGIAFGVAMIPVALVGVALFAGPGLLGWAAARSIVVALCAAAPFFLVFVAAMVFISALWLIFNSTVWTLVYREIAAREQAAVAVPAEA